MCSGRRIVAGIAVLALVPFVLSLSARQQPQAGPGTPRYDLLLRGGARDRRPQQDQRGAGRGDRRREDCRRPAAKIDPADAFKTIDLPGLYVTPGLVDIHTHTYAGTGEARSYAGRQQRLPGRLHAPRRRDDGRGRRRAPAGATSRTSSSASSIARRPASSRFSTSSATACAAGSTSRICGHGGRSRRPTWRAGIRA